MPDQMHRLVAMSALQLSILCASGPVFAGDLSYATDPVGTLNQLTMSVSRRAKELEAIARELDKISAEIDAMEKLPAKATSKASFIDLDKRLKATVARSSALENQARVEFDLALKKIKALRTTLDALKSSRPNTSSRTLSDRELADCRKNLDELEVTVKELKNAVSDTK